MKLRKARVSWCEHGEWEVGRWKVGSLRWRFGIEVGIGGYVLKVVLMCF